MTFQEYTHVQILKELIILGPYADFRKRGCEFKGFTKGGADFEAKIRGVNSVSGDNLYDFEMISPAGGGCERTPARPCVQACI